MRGDTVTDVAAGFTDRDRPARQGFQHDLWLRAAVAILGVILSVLYIVLFSDTFEHGMGVAIFFTISAWIPAMYSLALMLQPWNNDALGRDRAAAVAAAAEARWYRSGIIGNLLTLLIVVGLVPAGVVHLSRGQWLEPMVIVFQLLVIALLALLYRRTRQKRSAPSA